MASLMRHKWFWPTMIALLTIVGLIIVPEAIARPGGGSSYSGGGGGFGGGGGSGGGDGAGAILYLIIRYPHIGIPLLIIIIAYKYYTSRNEPQEIVTSGGNKLAKISRTRMINAQLENFKREDEHFSQTLFLDFSQHLYYQVHHWRSKPEFMNLRPYFDPNMFQNLASHHQKAPVDVTELVIGNVEFTAFAQSPQYDMITIDFDANYTETRQGHSNRFIVTERWSFRRAKGVWSKGPEDMGDLSCPNCGSSLEVSPTGECVHCSTTVNPGQQHWEVAAISTLRREVQPAQKLGHYEAERGTGTPTIYDPDIQANMQRFAQEHAIADFGGYWASMKDSVIKPVFHKVYEAWEEQNWEKARPLMTDFLFMSQKYWMDAYAKANVTNKLDDLQVGEIVLAKVDIDKYYESFTVRVYASVKDYMVSSSGQVIGGSRNNARVFSEYWTFVRRAGVEKPPQDYNPDACPNCGAPIKMGQTGICGYCDSKVTTGEFNWVLSRISQDEAYVG